MGGIVTRERRQPAQRTLVPQTEPEEMYPEASQSKSPSRVDTVKTEPRTLPHPKHMEQNQDLTEEMIAGLTRSSSDSGSSKTRKREVLENWLLRASYKVTPENDALERHRRSMEALRAMPQTKRERGLRSKPETHRTNSSTRGSQRRQPPNVEIYRTVPTAA
jgi:hypothetical protein